VAETSVSSRIRCDAGELARPFADPGVEAVPEDPAAAAYARGFADGLAAGRREVTDEMSSERVALAAKTGETIARLCALEASLTSRHEARLVDIALAAASRVARARIEEGDPVASRALREAMETLPAAARLEVRVNPADLEAVSQELAAEIERGRVEMIPDARIDRGGCVVDSTVGTVDATLGTAEAAVGAAARGAAEPL
jgi:flagellar assembly protein FliH